MIGHKVVYEDENGIPMNHWDESSNMSYNNTNSGLNSDNAQDAIDELAGFKKDVALTSFKTQLDIDGETLIVDYDTIKNYKGEIPLYPTQVSYQDETVRIEDFKEYIYCHSNQPIDWNNYNVLNYKNPRFWVVNKIIEIDKLSDLPTYETDNTYKRTITGESRSEYYMWVGTGGDINDGTYQTVLGHIKTLSNTSSLPTSKATANCIYKIGTLCYIWIDNPLAQNVLDNYETFNASGYSLDIAKASSGSVVSIAVTKNAIYYKQSSLWSKTVPTSGYVYYASRSLDPNNATFKTFSNPVQVDLDTEDVPQQSIPTNDYLQALRDQFDTINADYIKHGKIVRRYLQAAIDYASGQQANLKFPNNETFEITLECPNPNLSAVEYMEIGLTLKEDSVIDLNSSTIKCKVNYQEKYNIVYIPYFAKGAILKNGNIIGDKDGHYGILNYGLSQYNYALFVEAERSTVHGLKIGDVFGDGVYLQSPYTWGNATGYNIATNRFVEGSVNNFGVFTQGSNTGVYVTPLLNATKTLNAITSAMNGSRKTTRLFQAKDVNICLKPTLDITQLTYVVNPEVQIYFYAGNSESNFIKKISVRLGDAGFKVPVVEGTDVYYRVAMEAEAPIATALDATVVWASGAIWQYGATISHCEIYNCGRNGMVPTSLRNLVITDCYIHDIGGNSNQVGIDFEGSSYIDGYVTVRRTRFANIGALSIALAQGCHYIIEDCDLGSIGGNNPDVHISNSTIRGIVSFNPKPSANVNTVAKNSIDNCLILGKSICAYNTLVKNCVIPNTITDIPDARTKMSNIKNAMPVYEYCTFKGGYILLGQYRYCKFNAVALRLDGMTNSEFTFDNCEFNVRRIETPVRGAYPNISIRHSVLNFINLGTDAEAHRLRDLTLNEFTNNVVNFADSRNVATSAIIGCQIGSHCIIANNVFNTNAKYIATLGIKDLASKNPGNVIIKDNILNTQSALTLLNVVNSLMSADSALNPTDSDKNVKVVYTLENNVFNCDANVALQAFAIATTVVYSKIILRNNIVTNETGTVVNPTPENVDIITL